MSANYSVTRDEIISSSLRKLGVLELGDTPDANTVTNAAQALNLMIKQWMTEGIKVWTVSEYTLPLVASQTVYTIAPSGGDLTADKPLKILQGWLRNTTVSPQIDLPLQILSKQEYNLLGSKYSTGTPNSVFLDPLTTSSKAYFYLTPDSTAATTYQAHLVVQKPIQDISAAGSIADFPNEWMQALVWGLADQLAIEYGLPANHRQEIEVKAERYRVKLEDWDIESTATYFQPTVR